MGLAALLDEAPLLEEAIGAPDQRDVEVLEVVRAAVAEVVDVEDQRVVQQRAVALVDGRELLQQVRLLLVHPRHPLRGDRRPRHLGVLAVRDEVQVVRLAEPGRAGAARLTGRVRDHARGVAGEGLDDEVVHRLDGRGDRRRVLRVVVDGRHGHPQPAPATAGVAADFSSSLIASRWACDLAPILGAQLDRQPRQVLVDVVEDARREHARPLRRRLDRRWCRRL